MYTITSAYLDDKVSTSDLQEVYHALWAIYNSFRDNCSFLYDENIGNCEIAEWIRDAINWCKKVAKHDSKKQEKRSVIYIGECFDIRYKG